MIRFVIPFLCVACLSCEDEPSSRPAQYPPPGYYPMGPPPNAAGPAPGPPPSGPALRPDEISSTITASNATFSDCYMKSESFMGGRSGAVTIFFEVAPAGNVTSASDRPPPGASAPALAALHDPNLNACLSQRFFSLRFRTSSESTPASWTFQFSP